MPRRCPPGVFCFENVTIVFICSILLIIGGFLYWRTCSGAAMASGAGASGAGASGAAMASILPVAYVNSGSKGRGNDVFFDIYNPPMRDDNCSIGLNDIRGNIPIRARAGQGALPYAMPINTPTQECGDSPFRQIGILTRQSPSSSETILPLMGRPRFRRRDKWNFYTLNDKNNMIKLPIRVKGRDALDENGCDNVYTGDIVQVEGYNEAFKVTAYNNQIMRYLPTDF
jgi:hypothetical protein